MGHGASTEHHEQEGQRYFCHACSRGFVIRSSTEECIICGSSFIEEMTGVHGRSPYQFNESQARRLTNAAALLQLLELQLREELEALRSSIANDQDKNQPLTQIMKDRLRTMKINVEMLCEQPSCPICSEDYKPAEEVLRLPCAHVFHGDCVLPWLESKKTCPICRFELKNELPSAEEIDSFSSDELRSRIHNHIEIEDSVMDHETRQELAKRYSDIIQEEFNESQSENEVSTSSPEEGLILTNSFQRRPTPMSTFLQQHRLQQSLMSGSSPGVASDPRSLINYRNLIQNSSHGIIRQIDDSDSAAENDEDDSTSNRQDVPTLNYRVIANPSIRFISTSANDSSGPRVIRFRTSEGSSNGTSVRVISYPRSMSHERSDSPTPVTYILRHVPSSGGSGYVPIAIPHRPIPDVHSDGDSDDGL